MKLLARLFREGHPAELQEQRRLEGRAQGRVHTTRRWVKSERQVENDEPQPHEDFALGFSNLKPALWSPTT